MTKWVALALGALLALVGAVCIWLGYAGIQTERGGVLVIAGAVALTGGVLTFALFAVLGELQSLLAARSMQPLEGAPLMAAPTPVAMSEHDLKEAVATAPLVAQDAAVPSSAPIPIKTPEPPPSPPVFHEPPAPAVPETPSKPVPPEQKTWERASPFRYSSFGAPRAPTPLAVFAGSATVAAAAVAVRSEAAEPVPEPPAPVPETPVCEPVAAEVEDQVELAIALALADESPAEAQDAEEIHQAAPPEAELSQHAEASEEIPDHQPQEPSRQPRSLREALGLQELPPEETQPQDEETPPQDEKPAEEQAKPAPTPLIDVEASPSVAAGYAWLERALATEDGRKSRALEWLRARQRSVLASDSLLTDGAKTGQDAQPQGEPAAEATPKSAPETPEAVETETGAAREAVGDLEAAPDHERAPDAEQKASDEPPMAPEEVQSSGPVLELIAQEESAELEATNMPEPEPEQPAAPAPTIVGRYSSGGSDFTLYSDGSIDAQTDQGIFHFASMAELRAHIEAQNEQG